MFETDFVLGNTAEVTTQDILEPAVESRPRKQKIRLQGICTASADERHYKTIVLRPISIHAPHFNSIIDAGSDSPTILIKMYLQDSTCNSTLS